MNRAHLLRPGEPEVGAKQGKYKLIAVRGRGGMGLVYEAEDTLIRRRVALKLLPPSPAEDGEAFRRFLAEARAAGRLHHPNIVSVYDVVRTGKLCFLVMELVAGGTAQDRLQRRGPLDLPAAVAVMLEVCRGLAAAHSVGLVHRDLKPANIMRAADGTVKLADFGLAKILDASTGSGGNPALLGTPHYMSPEQCRCETPDARSDLYAAGAVFFALLTGRPPYHDAGGVSEVMLSQCSAPPPDPRSLRPDLPEAAAALIAKAMAKERPARHQSADALADDLRRLAAGSPVDLPGGPDWPALEALSADLGTAVRRRDLAALEAALERLCAAARPRPADAADAADDWSPAE